MLGAIIVIAQYARDQAVASAHDQALAKSSFSIAPPYELGTEGAYASVECYAYMPV